jgi:charged multivesicular body protein 6
MGCFFATSNHHEPTITKVNEDDRAEAEIKVTRDELKAYLRRIQKNIGACKSAIKASLGQKQREKAMLALRKQKYLEKNAASAEAELNNIEQVISEIDQAKVHRTVFIALKQGNDLLANFNQQLKLEDVQKLMEDTAEAVQYQQEISAALAHQGIAEDDDDLLKQLDELDAVEALAVELPSAPQRPLPRVEGREDRVEEAPVLFS